MKSSSFCKFLLLWLWKAEKVDGCSSHHGKQKVLKGFRDVGDQTFRALFFLFRCWRRLLLKNLWRTDPGLSWTRWSTETGWDETTEFTWGQQRSVFERVQAEPSLWRMQMCCCCLPHQARLWVQLMKELRQGVKLKKVQEQPFNPLPTEFSLTPFEMLMQDIRGRKFQLRKVMVRVLGSVHFS